MYQNVYYPHSEINVYIKDPYTETVCPLPSRPYINPFANHFIKKKDWLTVRPLPDASSTMMSELFIRLLWIGVWLYG